MLRRTVSGIILSLLLTSVLAFSINVQTVKSQSATRRVLFDMLHVEQYRFYCGYSRLYEELSARGYVLYQIGKEQFDTGELTHGILEDFDVLVLPNPQLVAFAPSEIQAIIDFVQGGGGLLVLGGSHPVKNSDYPVKDLITFFQIEYELPITELDYLVTDISTHPVTRNVATLDMPSVKALNATIAAQGIAFSQGKPVIAVAEFGGGRVVAVASPHMFANWDIESNDNLLLGLNTFEWLSKTGGGPYPQELPLIKIESWNPPRDMVAWADYGINVEIQNMGNDSVSITVTVPNIGIFNKTGWGVGELVGNSKKVNVPAGATVNVSLIVWAPICGYTYLEIQVYTPYDSSHLVFDGKHTEKVIISCQIMPEDINRDGKVDIKDLAAVSLVFGSYPGHPRWNRAADINHDNKVDIKDLVLIAKNFGNTYP